MVNYASLHDDIMWWTIPHSTKSNIWSFNISDILVWYSTELTLLLSDHSISPIPLWFWMIDKLCQPAIWYHVVNAYTQYTVNPPTVWLINITSTVNSNAWVILGGFLVDWTEFFFHLQVVNFLCFTSANNSFGFCVNILYANKLYIKSNFSHQIDHFILIN